VCADLRVAGIILHLACLARIALVIAAHRSEGRCRCMLVVCMMRVVSMMAVVSMMGVVRMMVVGGMIMMSVVSVTPGCHSSRPRANTSFSQ
jgi:hypothetical protein